MHVYHIYIKFKYLGGTGLIAPNSGVTNEINKGIIGEVGLEMKKDSYCFCGRKTEQ